MIRIRVAAPSDWPFWRSLDRRIEEPLFLRKAGAGECYVAEWDGTPAGLMRWGLFWDEVPFCSLLYIAGGWRGQGLGRALLKRWEADMRAAGHDWVMTSTQADESAQHFYRKLGYRDAGGFLPGTGQPLELILVKVLNA